MLLIGAAFQPVPIGSIFDLFVVLRYCDVLCMHVDAGAASSVDVCIRGVGESERDSRGVESASLPRVESGPEVCGMHRT